MSQNKYDAAEPGAFRRMNAQMGTSLLTGHSSNVQSIEPLTEIQNLKELIIKQNKYDAAEPGALRRMNAQMGTSLLTGHSSNVKSLEPLTEIQNLKQLIIKQNETIMEQLGEIKVYVRHLLKTHNTNEIVSEMFPLKCTEAIVEFEHKIPHLKEDDLIAAIQKIIERGGISKNIRNLLGEDVIKNYNYDGIHNKKSFKNQIVLDDVFYKVAAKDTITRANYVVELKKGFKAAKTNSIRKNVCGK